VTRSLRLAGYIGIGIVAGLTLATLVIVLLTRTEWGMERARRFVVSWLEDRVEGELRVSRITGPGLLGGVIVHDFAIVDPRGRPFLATDSLELAYDWRTLLAGRIVLNRVVLHRPRIVIERLPGDTAWNYELVFPPGEPGDPDQRSLILFNDARVLDGVAVIRMPWEPDGPVEPGDTARLVLEPVPGGIARSMRFEDVNARLGRVIWESPIEPGRLFDVQMLQARGFIWREPFQVRNARGTLTTRDSVIAFDMPEVSLPASNASILGRIVMRTGRNDVDVRIDSRRLSFADLDWLYPNMPDDGGGSLTLRIQSQPDGILWLAEDARLATGGTNVAGSVGVVTGDTLYFTRVDLRASPLDVQLLERILPGGLPVDGLLVGTVEVRGPLSALETTGDLQLTGDALGSGSRIAWHGVLDVRGQHVAARSLRADVTNLELALISALNPGVHLTGSVTGRVQGTGRLDRMSFTAALAHESGGGRSSFDGSGSITGTGAARHFDVTLNAMPVTLEDLAAQVPALRGLTGELRGPVHVTGSGRALQFAADLETPAGELHLAGNVLRTAAAEGQRVSAVARVDRFRLQALWPGLPETLVSGRLIMDVSGADLATASGTLQLELDSARVRTLPLGALVAGGRIDDGLLHLDSASLYTVAGIGRARGSIGLLPSRRGTVEAAAVSESLTPLEAHVFGNVGGAAGESRLAGRLDAAAAATGWIGGLDVTAAAGIEGFVFGGTTAARLQAEAAGTDLRGASSRFHLTMLADSLAAFRQVFRNARAEATFHADSLAVSVDASGSTSDRFRAGAVVHSSDGMRTVRVDELRVGAGLPWALRAPATMTLGEGVAALDRAELRRAGGGTATASGRLAWARSPHADGDPLDFSVDLAGMPFTDVLGLLRSREEAAGTVDGRLRLAGTALDPLLEVELTGASLRYGEVRIDRAFAEASYAGSSLDAHAEAQHGGRSILTGGGRIPLDLRFADVGERRLADDLRFTVTADSLPPALPLGMVEGFSNVGGRIDGTLAFSGTTLQPALSGGFVLRNGKADWDATGVRYTDVRGTFVLEDDRTVGVDVRARTADPRPRGLRGRAAAPVGQGRITGTLGLNDLADPAFDLILTADRTYAAKRRDVEAFISGAISLGGRYSRPEVSGSLRVENGALYIDELYRQYLIVGLELDDPSLLSLVDTSLVAVRPLMATSQSPFLRNLQIRNLQVEVGNDSWLRSRDMDVEVSGSLNVTFDRQAEDLRLLGLLSVERGTYTLYYPPLQSRRFQVRDGSIEFPGTPGMDPNLAITASYRVRSHTEPLDVLAMVSGTLQSPRVRLSSDAQPPISESDLASYIFFGVPTWQVANTAGPGAGDVRAMAGLALRPSVLGYASSGLQTLVQGAGLFDYVSLTAAETAAGQRDGQGLGNLLTDTQLELGRYLPGTNIYVGYTQRLGTAGSEPAGRLEWRFLPEFTFELFVEDRFARTPGLGMRSEAWFKKVYGFSLFREWGF
jgi:hypothetical protein